MIRHSFTVVNKAIQSINPGQVPILTFDQPLYALAKQIQWQWPISYGENRFVIMMGGLHIEMASLRMLGHWLDGSGWVHCLVQSGFTTSGVAESFIHASHVKRTRYAHTVTAAALYLAQQNAYRDFCNGLADEGDKLNFNDWCKQKKTSSTQFLYWDTVLDLELLMLSFVRSIREQNFALYIESIQKLAPWFFVLDQTNYARWLSVHVRDMLSLKDSHPSVQAEFVAGNFSISKTCKNFSAISIDHAHEQLNALIKGDGGAIGLTENEAALGRWVIAGPEITRILTDLENSTKSNSDNFKSS